MSNFSHRSSDRWENEGGSLGAREAMPPIAAPRFLTECYQANGRWFANLTDTVAAAGEKAVAQ